MAVDHAMIRQLTRISRRTGFSVATGKQGLVEIVVLSGFYQMFAAINQGFDIHPPAAVPGFVPPGAPLPNKTQ
jgi:hypothetical protein